MQTASAWTQWPRCCIWIMAVSYTHLDVYKRQENVNPLEQDAYPEVNELIQNYYNYMAAGDMEGLATVEDTTTEEEQNKILRSSDLV